MKGSHWGFGLAAAGMALGLTQYLLLRRGTLGDVGHTVANPLDRRGRVRYGAAVLVVGVLVVVLALAGVITATRLSTIVVEITVVATVALFAVILTSSRISAEERSRVVAFVPMFAASPVFWSLFQQQSTVVAVYADQRLDLAELCLSPVGQSLSTKFAPAASHRQMIALYFLSIAVGTATAGTLAGCYDPAHETPYFLIIGAASIVVGALLLLGRRRISARIAGVR